MPQLKQLVVSILTWEARVVLLKYKPRIIAITGSVGKTTTKDAVFAALSGEVYARKSAKSYNSEFGVPLTILGCENAWNDPWRWFLNIIRGLFLMAFPHTYPDWLILEVGADRPGDIRSIAKWLRPDIAVITGVPDMPVHVEFFNSVEDVLREKRSLAEHLKPGGKVILNTDEPRMRNLHSDFRGASVTYGMEGECDFYASHEAILYGEQGPEGIRFRVDHSGSSLPVVVYGALGRPRIYAATAALAVADCVGIDGVTATRALAEWDPPPGRVRILKGLKGSIIIDDTYNSSPAAALAALDTLKAVNPPAGEGRRIAIMGDMLELGKYSAEGHRAVGERAATSADMLITIGFRARTMAEAALDAGMSDSAIRQYEHGEAERAGKELLAELRAGDVVLVKGSQGMRMEKTVLQIMAEQEKAADLLVRMDPEWQIR